MSCLCYRYYTEEEEPKIEEVKAKLEYFDPEIEEKIIESIKQGFRVEKIREYKVKLSDYKFLKILGSGAFGAVSLVKNKHDQLYACKAMKKAALVKNSQVEHIKNEFLLLSTLYHPFIVKYIGYDHDPQYLYLFLEVALGGELFTYLRSTGKFDETASKFYAGQVTAIFEYLNRKDLIYRDLKPENLLIDYDGYLKMVDFGFAKYCPGKTYTLCGTPNYIAPEIILNKGHGKPVDWWALGIFIYELLMGIDPFGAMDVMQIYENILAHRLRFTRSFPDDAKSLVKHLIVADLSRRYGNLKEGPDDIKNHRWFKNFDFTSLTSKLMKPHYIPIVQNKVEILRLDAAAFDKKDAKPMEPQADPFRDW